MYLSKGQYNIPLSDRTYRLGGTFIFIQNVTPDTRQSVDLYKYNINITVRSYNSEVNNFEND